jgi:hypothetical protein
LRLVNPYSPVNTVRAPLKTSSDRALEERKWRQNAGYALGVFPRNFEAQERHDREAAREARLKELGERVRAAYDFPPLDRDSPPVVLGQKLGEGGQGSAYAVEGRRGRAVKVFRGAALAQLEEMAAILNTVADDGAPIERVELARLKGGGWGLEMRDLSRERGWINLATYVRVHPKAAAERKLVSRADKALFALGRETKRVLGFDAADWKAGFAGEISDDYLENFAYNPETGELTCFDGLVRW